MHKPSNHIFRVFFFVCTIIRMTLALNIAQYSAHKICAQQKTALQVSSQKHPEIIAGHANVSHSDV